MNRQTYSHLRTIPISLFQFLLITRGVARIFGLGGRPCRVERLEPDPASTEVAKLMRGVWVLPQKNFADPNA